MLDHPSSSFFNRGEKKSSDWGLSSPQISHEGGFSWKEELDRKKTGGYPEGFDPSQTEGA